jgi:uncharacterized membrane protein YdjX (TVP38/TMEM64 family)
MFTNRAYIRRLLFLGIIIVVAGLISSSDVLHMEFEDIIAAVEAIISRSPRLGMLLFVLLAMISAMLAFFSSAILVPIGVYTWGSITCFALLWIGWLLGGVTSFCIGRYLGRPVAEKLVGVDRISRFEHQLGRHARFVHILLFQAALPSEVPGYVLGALRYRFSMFMLALAIVELPYALGTVYLGDRFLERDIVLFLLIGSGGIVIYVISNYLYRRFGNTAKHTQESTDHCP